MDTHLHAIKTLFDTLNEQGIKYCHWKSNQHLDQSLKGATDLDILVKRNHQQAFKAVLFQLGCKSIISPPGKQYPAIEDYLGYDAETGKFFHLHVHYQLILGEQFVKNYRLPLEQQFLESAQICQGIKIVSPELEIIVLALRALLKYRDRDAIKDIFSIRTPGLPANILRELAYLSQQTSLERITEVLRSDVGFVSTDIVTAFLETVSQTPRAGLQLYRLRNSLRHELTPYQRYSRWQAARKYFLALWCRKMPFCSSFAKKKPASGGLLVALVGADGAGKSTTVKTMRQWLSWKLDARVFYMGSGEQTSHLSKGIKLISNNVTRLHRVCSITLGKKNGLSRLLGHMYHFSQYLYHISIAHTRYERFLASRKQASQGSIIIYDRYPLEGIHRVMNGSRPPMDGPRIAWMCRDKRVNALTGYLSRIEEKIYKKITPPDFLIILHVSLDMSLKRKPTHQREEVEPKITAIEAMDRCNLKIIDVDANQPLDQALLQTKSAVWKII